MRAAELRAIPRIIRQLQRSLGQLVAMLDVFAGQSSAVSSSEAADRIPPSHLFSLARSSSKKLCTTTSVGVPAMSAQLLSRTMRNR